MEAAGGFTEDAVPHVLNQALTLSDGIQIYIPTASEVRAAEEASMRSSAAEAFGNVTDPGAVSGMGLSQGYASAGSQDAGFIPEASAPGISDPGCIQENTVPGTGNAGTGLVNINTADAAALETLNGIGPARAQAIIEYRQTVSAFGTIEDIKKVSGIGNGIFSRIRDHITV